MPSFRPNEKEAPSSSALIFSVTFFPDLLVNAAKLPPFTVFSPVQLMLSVMGLSDSSKVMQEQDEDAFRVRSSKFTLNSA